MWPHGREAGLAGQGEIGGQGGEIMEQKEVNK